MLRRWASHWRGSPVLLQNPSRQHAVINAPVDPNSVTFARVLSGGSLPHVSAGSASTLDGFWTCSMFIRITACWLADPLSGLLHQGLRPFHCFHARLGCYRLERKLPGGVVDSPTGVLRLSTAHQNTLLQKELRIEPKTVRNTCGVLDCADRAERRRRFRAKGIRWNHPT